MQSCSYNSADIFYLLCQHNSTNLKTQLHGSNFGAFFLLKTASEIQNSNLIGWVNVIGVVRALALASIMMSFANVFGRPWVQCALSGNSLQ